MKTSLLSLSFLLLAPVLSAQDLNRIMPAPLSQPDVAPVLAPEDLSPEAILPGQAHEGLLMAQLRGVVLVGDPTGARSPAPAGFEGVDASAVPLLQGAEVTANLRYFLGRPVSLASLDRLAQVIRLTAQEKGEPFVIAYVPPQDLTAGVVRVVVRRARLDADIVIEGAEHFSVAQYTQALPLHAGDEIDAAALNATIEALNQNPFRRTVIGASAGLAPGTTRLTLRVQEERPWRFNAGYDNTGSAVTDENRLSASVTWGNAFGRGDVLSYRFTGDPRLAHSRAHSATYATVLPWRHTLNAFGAWSRIESELPAPLTQAGNSWQVGLRYGWTLPKLPDGWTQNLSFGPDFKYSDNTLEFAAIPVTDNVTHVAQFGATYTLAKRGAGQSLGLSVALYASPGGLSSRNKNAFFDVSRAGARADYFYGRIDVNYVRQLPQNFSLNSTLSLQAGSGELLGSEQLNGGGSSAVRGYAESAAFGDGGAVWLNELHLPGFSPTKTGDRLAPFVFVDVATLYTLGLGGEDIELASTGVGVNYQWRKNFTLRAAYGWQLKDLGPGGEDSRAHLSASFGF